MPQPNNLPQSRTCPGWGEECGADTKPGADLCPTCHAGRLDAQSPRIPA